MRRRDVLKAGIVGLLTAAVPFGLIEERIEDMTQDEFTKWLSEQLWHESRVGDPIYELVSILGWHIQGVVPWIRGPKGVRVSRRLARAIIRWRAANGREV